MKSKVITDMVLTLFLASTLTLTFNVQSVKETRYVPLLAKDSILMGIDPEDAPAGHTVGFGSGSIFASYGAGNYSFASFADFRNQVEATSNVTEKMAMVDAYMQERAKIGFPVVEGENATFVYRGIVSKQITVAGDMNYWDTSKDVMTRLTETDLYYKTMIFPLDARLDYKFVRDGSWILDPLNNLTILGGFGPNSELRMPNYVPPPEIEYYPSIPHGTIETIKNFHSNFLKNDRNIYVYLPPGYNTSEAYPTFYVNDGREYIDLAYFNNVVDYLLNEGAIKKIIVVFVPPVNRAAEYHLNENYMKFIVDELVPYIDSHYSTLSGPSARGIMGASYGGLISIYIAYNRSDVFGMCAGQSSYYSAENDLMINAIRDGPKKDIRFYVDCGTFDITGFIATNRQMRDAMLAKGYDLMYQEFHEGHSWGNWRARIDDILKFFFRINIVTATIDVDPNTLNLKSKGKWITCYIELPEGYNVSDIKRSSILLNDTIPVDPFWVNKTLESVIGDYDNDTISDLMVKFNRSEVISLLNVSNQTIKITGELKDGTPFEGADMVRAIHRSDLLARMTQIHTEWTFASLEERTTLFQEIVDIDMLWPYAPP